MGCDIYCVIEKRNRSDGKRWRCVAPLDLRRNYHLFGILAGVRRSDLPPIAPPRGEPPDLDPAISLDVLGEHSRSWLTLAELRAYDWWQLIVDEGIIPLRSVDVRSLDRWSGVDPEPYEEWRITRPHRPRQFYRGGTGMQLLDLRGDHRQDEATAARYLDHPEEMPEPKPEGMFGDGTRVATALVQWTIVARDTCSEFYGWMQAQTFPGEDLRIVFGFDG